MTEEDANILVDLDAHQRSKAAVPFPRAGDRRRHQRGDVACRPGQSQELGLRTSRTRPGNVRLRKISSPHPGHLHPDGSEASPQHKHYWTEVDEDRWTYEPTDIRWDNHHVALADFARECTITLTHDVPDLLFQGDHR